MKQNLRVSLGAVVLALATLAAMIFAWLNFVQRETFETPDDGVAWLHTATGVQAWKLAPNSPASQAGIRPGDFLISINNVPVHSQVQVTRRLWHAGLWTQVRYKLARNSREFETPIVTAPAEKPNSIENYGRFVGLLYLFIGLFIFVRRWNAPRAIHFYVFCLVSFILYSFQYSGKLDAFDYEVYWASVVARLLAPALLLHFALVFPERAEGRVRSLSKLTLVYGPAAVLLFFHISTAFNMLGFVPWLGSRLLLDKVELSYLGIYFLAAGLVFYKNFRSAPAVEVANRRNFRRQRPLRDFLYRSVRHGRRNAFMDAHLGPEPRAHPALLRLRHHPLSLDGRGHHLQARLGIYRRHRRRRRHLFRLGRAHRPNLPRPNLRPRWRHDRHRDRRVPISTFPRMDSGAPRSFLLPRPPRLSPHAHRIRPHPDQRSALRSHAWLGNGPPLPDPPCRSHRHFHGRSHAPWKHAPRALHGCASLRAYGSHLPRAGPARVRPRGALLRVAPCGERGSRFRPSNPRAVGPELFRPLPHSRAHRRGPGSRQNGRWRFPLQRRRRASANHRWLCRRGSGQRATLFLTRAESPGDRAPQGFQRKHRRILKRRCVGRRPRRHGRVLEHAYGAALWREATGRRRPSAPRAPPRRTRFGNCRAPRRRANHRHLQAAPASPG